MKLLYENIVIGELSELSRDMYRESGILALYPINKRESSEISEQLFERIEIGCHLEELELELDDEEYENSTEVEELWERCSQLPDFENHHCWKLFEFLIQSYNSLFVIQEVHEKK